MRSSPSWAKLRARRCSVNTQPRGGVLLEDVLLEIKGAEPNLTDHGPDHIRNVLDNVDRLLGVDGNHFTAMELYLLGLCVLLHDVGNLDGRDGHNKRIAEYYSRARSGSVQQNAPEKRLVVAAAQAHSGRSEDGSLDTLADVPDVEYLNGERVRLQEIATVVRFADELAEGPQRTSLFLLEKGRFSDDSEKYHRYASVTQIAIDRRLRRISLSYVVHMDALGEGRSKQMEELRRLLEYIGKRINKLDEERKYARYYCPELLLPLGMTSVSISVANESGLDFSVDRFSLSDKLVPSGGKRTVSKAYFNPASVVRQIDKLLGAS